MAQTAAAILVDVLGEWKVTVEQAGRFAQSLIKGQPNGDKIALTVLSDTVRELV